MTAPALDPARLAREGTLLHDGRNSTVYRIGDGDERYIVKVLRTERALHDRVARYRTEYELSARVGSDRIVRALAMQRLGGSYAIVFEDIGAIVLREVLASEDFDLRARIGTLRDVALALAELHREGIVHNDLNPANVVRVPGSGQIQLIDLGLASDLPKQRRRITRANRIEGTAAYLSPEQTGRVSLPVDERSDLYALGVTAYELLTGRLPFERDDLLDYVYAHLTAVPPGVAELAAEVPAPVASLVDQLLAKQPDERPESAERVAEVLSAVLDAEQRTGAWPDAVDIVMRAPRFRVPQGLYGRDREIEALEAALAQADASSAALVTVAGESGTGKSALVERVRPMIARRDGWFLTGKFDQVSPGVAYGVFVQALRDFLSQLQASASEEHDRLLESLKSASAGAERQLIDLLPALGEVLESNEPQATLSTEEASHRLRAAMVRILNAIAADAGLLVVFLDDLQWSDPGSISLLRFLLEGQELRGVVFMVAFRDNEVPAGGPLSRLLRARYPELYRRDVTVGPLADDALSRFVSDMLLRDDDEAEALTRLLLRRTDGNPLFVRECVETLAERGAFAFADDIGAWRWDRAAAQHVDATDNVVAFLARRQASLPAQTREALGVAACAGATFQIGEVAACLGCSHREAADALRVAIEIGHVDPLDHASPFSSAWVEDARASQVARRTTFRFSHDRIQEAAYQSMTVHRRQQVHLSLARIARFEWEEGHGSDALFRVVEHLGSAVAEVPVGEEAEWAGVALAAATAARAATAYANALTYALLGERVLEGSGAEASDLRFELKLCVAEASYLTGEFELSDAAHAALSRMDTDRDGRARIAVVRADQLLLQGRYEEGCETILAALETLGITFATDDTELRAQREHADASVRAALGERRPEDLLETLSPTDEPEVRAAVQLLYGLFLAAYLSSRGQLALTLFVEAARITIERGYAPLSGYVLVGYGMVLSIEETDYEFGHRIARVGVQLAERFDSQAAAAKTNFLFAADVHNWARPVRESIPFYQRAEELAHLSGDWLTLGYVAIQRGSDSLTSGVLLDDVERVATEHLGWLERTKNADAVTLLHAGTFQPLRHLRGQTSGWTDFDTPDLVVDDYSQRHEANPFFLGWLYAGLIRAAYLTGDHDLMRTWARRVSFVEQHVPSHAKVPESVFFAALCRISLLREASGEEADEHEVELNRLIGRLTRWADVCEANNRHRLDLVVAELDALRQRIGAAVEGYERAIERARAERMPHHAGVALRCYAAFWCRRGRVELGLPLLHEAAAEFALWGATACVDAIAREISDLVATRAQRQSGSSTEVLDSASFSTSTSAQVVDVETIVRASEAISEEIDYARLLERVLRTVLQQSGATSAVVVVEGEESGWEVAACLKAAGTLELLRLDLDADEEAVAKLLRPPVVWRALRNGDSVRIDDATSDDRAGGARSVFCLPLRQSSRVTGAIYLENRLLAGAFPEARVAVLRYLATQVAYALSNARLYQALDESVHHLEDRVAERTQELELALEDLQRTQKELTRTARLASLSTMVAGIAHELNTPLGVALTATSLLSTGAGGETSARALELIRSNVERAASLVKSFKEVSGHQASESPRRVDLGAHVRHAVDSLAPFLRRERLDVRLQVPDTPVEAEVLGGRVAQVVANLVENAAVHAYPGCEGVLDIRIDEQGEEVRLLVSDHGAGMPADVVERCLDPFFTTRRTQGGTGLGLFIVFSIVTEELQGRMKVRSELGKGTQVEVCLPRVARASEGGTGS